MTSRRPTWILLALIVALALVLDVWFYSGFFASDDTEYIQGAHSLVSDAVDGPPLDLSPGLGNARLGMTVPGAVVYWLSGGSIDAMAWFHVLYHLGLVVLAFVLGRLLRDDTAGLLAALLAAGNPLFYLYAGAVLPDNATAFWLGLAMVALEIMRRRARDDSAAVTRRQALVGYMAAGAALGLAYGCKETALIMTVPAAVWVMAAAPGLREPVWIRNGAFLAVGLLAFVAVEMIGLRVIMGEWVWRLGIVEGGGELLAQRMAEQGATPLERFGFAYEHRLAPFVPLSLWLMALGAVSYALTGGRGIGPNIGLMAFFWWPLLYITIGSTSFTAYRPPSLQTRYYSIVLLPALLMVAVVLSALLSRWSAWRQSDPVVGRGRWRRALAAVPRAVPAIAIAVALLVMIGAEADRNASRAGNLYRATMVRSFVEAYQRARAECPLHPIVLSRYYRRRMNPVFFPRAPGDVQAGALLTPWDPPDPPFVYIGLATEAHGDHLKADHGEVALHDLGSVHAPATRGEMLAHRVRRMAGLGPGPAMARTPHHGSVSYLVTRPGQGAGGCASQASRDARWFSLRRGARITAVDDGTVVSWHGSESLYIQLFDPSSYREPPASPAAQLAGEPRAVTVQLEFRLIRGDPVEVVVTAFGYGDDGAPVRGAGDVTLSAREQTTRVPVVLESDRPLGSYRVRVRLDRSPGSSRAAELYIGPPRVRGPAGPGEGDAAR